MLDRIKRTLTYANVMSTLAVFAVLGGGAYAAAAIGAGDIRKNAVRSEHIKNQEVRAADLRPGAVKGSRLADGAVGAAKLANDAVDSAKVLDDSLTADDIDVDTLGTLRNVAAATSGITDPPPVPAQGCFTGDIAVAGVQPGDHVVLTTPQTLSSGLNATPLIPNANNEVRIRFCNVTGAPIDEPARTFNLIVLRP